MTTTHKTPQRLPEVRGACDVEEESRREVAVVQELDEFLPDEGVKRHLVRLVAQVDDESVDAERVAGQVERDEDARDDKKSLGDAELSLMSAGQHAPRTSCRCSRAGRRRRNRTVTGRGRPWRRSPQQTVYSTAVDARHAQVMALLLANGRTGSVLGCSVWADGSQLILLCRGAVGGEIFGGVVSRGVEAPGGGCDGRRA